MTLNAECPILLKVRFPGDTPDVGMLWLFGAEYAWPSEHGP